MADSAAIPKRCFACEAALQRICAHSRLFAVPFVLFAAITDFGLSAPLGGCLIVAGTSNRVSHPWECTWFELLQVG